MARILLFVIGLLCADAATNPFLDGSGKERDFYINPVNSAQYETSIKSASGPTRTNLEQMQMVPSAYWIDVKDKIKGSGTRSVEGILKDASSSSPAKLVVLIWYDLPNRDCFAKASNGEICCTKKHDGTCDYSADGDCAEGIQEYKSEYVDPFVSVLKEYQDKLPIVIVVEPDSLPNLATNLFHPGCGSTATQRAYKVGIKYTLQQLTEQAPSVAVYLDASHGGWLGWENSMEKFMNLLKSLDMPKIRGFATNVANYQPLGVQCPWCPDQGYRNSYCLAGRHSNDPCCEDPCDLLGQYNFGNNELNFAAGLVAAADSMLGMDAHVVIDTGRNGVGDHRQKCSSWCNPRGAGAGVKSTTSVANSSLVDAYFWLKTPGESDGCTELLPDGSRCPRFDYGCNSEDSLGSRHSEPRAPEAGHWFDHQVKELAANARFEPQGGSSGGGCSSGSNGGGNNGWGGSSDGGSHNHGGGSSGGGDSHADSHTHSEELEGGSGDGGSSHGGSSGGGSSGGGACSPAFGQCGGHHWKGPQCCEGECHCRREGKWYHQCEPPSGTHLCSRRLLLNVTSAVELRGGPLRNAPTDATLARGVRVALIATLSAGLLLTAMAVSFRCSSKACRPGPGRGGCLTESAPLAERRALLDVELQGSLVG